MPRPLRIRKPHAAEVRKLLRLLEEPLALWQHRRVEVLLLYAAGMNGMDIAQALQIHFNTVYADLRAFGQQGLACVQDHRSAGAPVRIDEAHQQTIRRIADQPPAAWGLPYGRWSMRKLRDYLVQQRLIPKISAEHLRRLLKKRGSPFVASGAKSLVPIPAVGRF